MALEEHAREEHAEAEPATPATPGRPGRKRDHSRDPEILQCTIDVLAETGFEGMTIEMVAARAKAGKATLYRRWASKGELVVDAVDSDKIAVSRNGTLFLAGASPTGGSRRRREPGGKPTILLDDLKVSDVGVLPDRDLVATTVEPGAVYRVDARTGAHTRLAR